jgi:dTDP-4-amino-4,6-dideoxygalactose transaminase
MSEYTEKTKFIDLVTQQDRIRPNLEEAIKKVLDHGQYVMGPEVKELEADLKKFTGSKFALTCANGTDALTLALMAWNIGPGDAVFVPAFTYVATAEAPAQLGATPFFVDVNEHDFNINIESLKQAIVDAKNLNLRPSVIISVDLFGYPSDFDLIKKISLDENIKLLIDGAQSFGGEYKNKRVGSMGDITTTSFFPAKPLGCYGDGGAIFTDDDKLADKIDSIRLHGKGNQKYDNIRIGLNSRLDTLQAAILIEKLKIFPEELQLRAKISDTYSSKLENLNYLKVPKLQDHIKSAWAQYTLIVQNRNEIMAKLQSKDIPSVIYYPKTLDTQDGYKKFPSVSSGLDVSHHLMDSVMSLPMHPYLSEEKIEEITQVIIN